MREKIRMNKKELMALKEYANQRITRVLDALGIDYNENYKYITAPCPIHGGDRDDAFSWHLDYNMFQCFSRGCHELYGKDVYALVRGVLDCNFPKSVQFLKDLFSGEELGDVKEILDLRDSKRFIESAKRLDIKVFPEELLSRLAYDSYLESRNYPKELVQNYQAGVSCTKYKRMSNRIIFPIRNIDGGIVGFTGRTLLDNWKELGIGKWEHSAGFDKEHNLFNIDRAKEHIAKSGVAIICEGPLDVLRLEQAGIHNGIGIFGRKLYNGQISLLIQAGATKLVIALDADTAGKTGAESALKTAKSFFNVEVVDLGDGDVGDLTVAEAEKLFGRCLT